MVYVNSSPRSQLLPVHPGAHVHSPGELHVPPLRQPPEQTTLRNTSVWKISNFTGNRDHINKK